MYVCCQQGREWRAAAAAAAAALTSGSSLQSSDRKGSWYPNVRSLTLLDANRMLVSFPPKTASRIAVATASTPGVLASSVWILIRVVSMERLMVVNMSSSALRLLQGLLMHVDLQRSPARPGPARRH